MQVFGARGDTLIEQRGTHATTRSSHGTSGWRSHDFHPLRALMSSPAFVTGTIVTTGKSGSIGSFASSGTIDRTR